MTKTKWWVFSLLVGTMVLAAKVGAQNGGSGKTIMLSCNMDGTYTCGGNCTKSPYNGRGCCQLGGLR